MKKLLSFTALLLTQLPGFCQELMTVLPDPGKSYSEATLGVKLMVSDFGVRSVNQDLHFSYTSLNTGFVMSHDMNLTGLNSMPNISLGVEENLGKHLLITFFNAGVGYAQHAVEWVVGTGAGYSFSLDRKNKLKLRAHLDFYYENISYGLGTYSDTTLYGFDINGVNIGTYIKNLKYVNSTLSANPGLELLFRTNKLDFFVGAGYSYLLLYKEKLEFYRTHLTINSGIFDPSGNRVNEGAILPGSYIIQLGIIKQFSL